MGYLDDIKIDKHNLDHEWERQSELYLQYSQMLANHTYQRDKTKEALDIIKAEVSSEIRKKPHKFGIKDKVTEGSINAALILDKRVQDAQEELNDATYDMNMFFAVKSAFEHKKTALEALSKLVISGYYSEPKIDNDARDHVIEERSKEIIKGLRSNKEHLTNLKKKREGKHEEKRSKKREKK